VTRRDDAEVAIVGDHLTTHPGHQPHAPVVGVDDPGDGLRDRVSRDRNACADVADDSTANHGADAEQSPSAQFAPDVARLVEVGLWVGLAIAASSTSDQRGNVVLAEPADLDHFVRRPDIERRLRVYDDAQPVVPDARCRRILLAGLRDQSIARSSVCDGVIQPRVCRGRPLSSSAMATSSIWVRSPSRELRVIRYAARRPPREPSRWVS
jgi:hypothetical protein